MLLSYIRHFVFLLFFGRETGLFIYLSFEFTEDVLYVSLSPYDITYIRIWDFGHIAQPYSVVNGVNLGISRYDNNKHCMLWELSQKWSNICKLVIHLRCKNFIQLTFAHSCILGGVTRCHCLYLYTVKS